MPPSPTRLLYVTPERVVKSKTLISRLEKAQKAVHAPTPYKFPLEKLTRFERFGG